MLISNGSLICLVVALDEVVLDSVCDPEPHCGAKELSAPVLFRLDVGFGRSGVANELGDVVGSHLLEAFDGGVNLFHCDMVGGGHVLVCRIPSSRCSKHLCEIYHAA